MVDYFGLDRLLTAISPGDGDEGRESLLRKGLSAATVSREVKRARQYFRAAVRKRLIGENPLADLPPPQQVNKSREFFISREMAEKILSGLSRSRMAADCGLVPIRGAAVSLETLAADSG